MADSGNDVNDPPHFTYIWTIENMCTPCIVDSPTFTVKEMEMTKWHVTICSGSNKFVELYIYREEDDGPNIIEIKYELSFLGIDGLPLIKKLDVKKFPNYDDFEFFDFADPQEVFSRRRTEFLPKDALTVRCRMWRTGTGISQLDSCFARTRLRPDRHFFVWAIREFSTLQRNEVRKILLNTTSTNQLTFNLFLTENDGEEYINISAQTSYDEDSVWYTVKICLLDFEGKVVHSKEEDVHWHKYFEFQHFFKKGRLMDDKKSLLPNDVLSLRCEVEMNAKSLWSVIENYRYFNSMSSDVIATDAGEILRWEQDETSNVTSTFTEAIKSLLEEGTLSDVSLRTDSESFPAHKCILSARSPVFKAMFGGHMKEKTSKCVEITDVDEDTLRELLSYIYTDSVGELEWRDAADLYRAADKYELLDLKRRCATFLKSGLSKNSVCTVLVVAEMHHDRELREAAQDFVMRQGAEFFTSDTWRKFKKDHSNIYVEILEQIVCNMKNHH
ncbi:TD and POZ domain-containing protein 4 [Araneus ventricosus]|uniref:TD and POZ domain-containing protein 4 n=1 Tax=Araneus ventricosus TaxID=182803 RepID=A0A4Y2II62_ARAVE|nr:TD and POZ domain-containing protein 4 [Araneus ventricosus]